MSLRKAPVCFNPFKSGYYAGQKSTPMKGTHNFLSNCKFQTFIVVTAVFVVNGIFLSHLKFTFKYSFNSLLRFCEIQAVRGERTTSGRLLKTARIFLTTELFEDEEKMNLRIDLLPFQLVV